MENAINGGIVLQRFEWW
uniref:Uncharacterized protein n=1 Tax=Rhizophora mucronata TaxID=61149 RepID=A0A2P2KQT2_RHIMU